MSLRYRTGALPIAAVLCAVALAGCSNPDAPVATTQSTTSSSTVQNAGEPPAPAPRAPSAESPYRVKPTPTQALEAFAGLYINWSYRTLSAQQHTLAAVSVGPARLAERQAAAASEGDTAIARGQIWNRGSVVSVAPETGTPEEWVVVTREETGGNTQYEGLGASYHVTLARLASVPGGYAVQEWLPQT
jgi:hypothetical protein